MPKAPPSFDFYYTNWIEGTDILSDKAYRCYLRLLIWQWTNGYLPETELKRMNVCHVHDKGLWDQVWSEISGKFVPVDSADVVDDDGADRKVLVNLRMHEQRNEQVPKYHHRLEANRQNGRLGGRPRKPKPKPKQNPIENPMGFKNETQTKPTWEEGRGKREDSLCATTGTSTAERSDGSNRSMFDRKVASDLAQPDPPGTSRSRSTKVDYESALASLPESIRDTVSEWFAYKAERGDRYKPRGLKAFTTQVAKAVDQYGEQAVEHSMQSSMANGWKGWDFKLKEGPQKPFSQTLPTLDELRGWRP